MTLIFQGLTTCMICGEVLNKDKPYTGFPAFTANRRDPLYFFNDAALHECCLQQHPDGRRALMVCEEAIRNLPASPHICVVDKQVITSYRKVISFGLLSSDQQEPLAAFNFIILNRDNLCRWPAKALFIKQAVDFISKGKWECAAPRDYLQELIDDCLSC
ncbi:hypothetical protein ECE50_028450 [Chitinophaga sp. Mgbs1]|uniref:Uncharacterized protein n=1 Tax=Chitinophaga solisilvae TaxID=1233460 RepID=A0A433WKC6_9BACT|nr:hypothetical protein [Chitinophaga solisilvae]